MKKITLILIIAFSASVAKSQTFPDYKGPYFSQNPPGNEPRIFAQDILVKDKQAHSSIVFSNGGTEAYWCHNGIWYSKIKNGKWTEPEMLPFSKADYGDDAPFISPDGKQLFFASKRSTTPSDTSKKENIWIVDILTDGWSEPRLLPTIINNVFQHWQMSVDDKGTIYFAHRDLATKSDDNNIFSSLYKNGAYSTPEKLSDKINSWADEGNPFISPDGSYLIFSRRQKGKPIDGGLFMSFKTKDGSWSDAVSLRKYIDYKYGGNCPFVSRDYNYLFYLDIFEGKYQRYWISADFIKKLRPNE